MSVDSYTEAGPSAARGRLRVPGRRPPAQSRRDIAGPDDAWDDLYYVTEVLAIAVCGLRVLCSAGAERAAWAVLTAGLTAYFLGDLYYELVLPADRRRTPRRPTRAT